VHKLKIALLSLLVFAIVATGPGNLNRSLATAQDQPRPAPAAVPASMNPRPDDAPHAGPGRMFVTGRVLDPRGEPVPGAMVAAHAANVDPGPPIYLVWQIPIGEARSDGSGRFRIDAPRTSSSYHQYFGAFALAPGYGVDWVDLDPDDDRRAADISLRPERVIHGRLFDLQGRPVPDVIVKVSSIRSEPGPAPAPSRRRSDVVSFGRPWRVNDHLASPRPVTTDAEGRFTLRGVGRGLHAALIARHPRFALQRIEVDTDDASGSTTVTAALPPPQVINVRVTYADTGQPAPHVPLRVTASQGRIGVLDEAETDAEGRCRVNSWPADRVYNIQAYPPEGQPYLTTRGRVEWPKGSNEMASDAEGRLALPVLIPGATYRFLDFPAGREAAPLVRKEFSVKPGETLDLGDILIERPHE
jgi:hypothetical protein